MLKLPLKKWKSKVPSRSLSVVADLIIFWFLVKIMWLHKPMRSQMS